MKVFTIIYDEEMDCYKLYFKPNKKWLFECSWECVKGPNGRKDFIHFSILNEINKHYALGYKYEPHTKEYFISNDIDLTF